MKHYGGYNQDEETIMSPVKEALKEILEKLPDEATWDDAFEAVTMKIKLEAARKDIAEGRTFTIDEIEKRFLG